MKNKKERIRVGEEHYLASASAITKVDDYGRFSYGDELGCFIVNPIYRKNIFGMEKIVGGVEAVSKTPLFTCQCIHTDVGIRWYYQDSANPEKTVGGIQWSANFNAPAECIVKREVLNEYFDQSAEMATLQVNSVREKARESVKCPTLSKAFSTQK